MKLVSLVVDDQKRIGYQDSNRDDLCVILDPAQGWPVEMKQLIASPGVLERLDGAQGVVSGDVRPLGSVEVPDPQRLDIKLRLNGQGMQDSNTSQLIFPVDHLIAHISQFVTLAPGDLIFTGTPPGVGAGRKPPVFLRHGDQLEVEIQGLGVLANPVVADS